MQADLTHEKIDVLPQYQLSRVGKEDGKRGFLLSNGRAPECQSREWGTAHLSDYIRSDERTSGAS